MTGAAPDTATNALRRRLRRRFRIEPHALVAEGMTETARPGLRIRELRFRLATGEAVRGFLTLPECPPPYPAVLVLHAHGGRYGIGAAELRDGRPALAAPLGPDLAARGMAALCCDLPCFGDRAALQEGALSKALLWEGGTLAGRMLGEARAALDWLVRQPDIRPGRIGLFGLSMGATLGYWLAALEPRIRALVQLCCLADFRALAATGAHDLHGPYLTVPSLLPLASNGAIAGLVAPRAQFVGLGDLDPLTPPAAAGPALAELRAAYAERGGRLVVHREPHEGHRETPAMRAAVLDFLTAELAADTAPSAVR